MPQGRCRRHPEVDVPVNGSLLARTSRISDLCVHSPTPTSIIADIIVAAFIIAPFGFLVAMSEAGKIYDVNQCVDSWGDRCRGRSWPAYVEDQVGTGGEDRVHGERTVKNPFEGITNLQPSADNKAFGLVTSSSHRLGYHHCVDRLGLPWCRAWTGSALSSSSSVRAARLKAACLRPA